MSKRIHADFIANFARPGAFNQLEAGFIFHYRERGPDGSACAACSFRTGATRSRSRPSSRRWANLVEKNDDVYLVLRKGSAQRPRGAGDSSIVTFEDYAIDLSQFLRRGQDVEQAPAAQPRHAGAAQVRPQATRPSVRWRARRAPSFTTG